MRIGQLARRLGVPPTEILGFLGTQNIETEGGANSRIADDIVVKVINQFAPEKLSEIMATPVEEPVVEAPVVETPEVVEEIIEAPVGEEKQPEAETPEVIRVAKVELAGLKVLGKIELPEPKKKAEPAAETSLPAETPRKEFRKRDDRREREWRNPIEQKRQQEQREAEQKKKEKAERLKEKRTNHYYSKVKSVPTKAVRRVEEQVVVEDIDVKEPAKGIFGKFLRWLRS